MGKDVRRYGDGNPGATNAFRAGGAAVGLLVLMLDISKAAAPVGFAYHNLAINGPVMVLIAIAPMLGHMFSPFLRFRGGKAVSLTLGIWIGLTLWKVPVVAVIFVIIGLLLFRVPGWAVMSGLAGILFALIIWMPDPLFFAVLALQVLMLAWTQRQDLRAWPRLQPGWIFRSR